jgi:hypothetical protein
MPQDVTIYAALFLVVLIAVIFAISALFLRLAAKWLQKVKLNYLGAMLTVFLAAVAHFGAGIGVVLLLEWIVPESDFSRPMNIAIGLSKSLLHLVGFFLQSAVIGWRLRLPYGRACLVTLVYFSLWLAVLAFCIPILIILSFFTMSGGEARQLSKPSAANIELSQPPS